MITNIAGSVTIDNGKIGVNAIPEGKTITVTANDSYRSFLGFRVDGVLLPRGPKTLAIDHTYAGKSVEAVYVTDWYVDAVGGDDDANDGMTKETPKKTLAAILSVKLSPNDTVHAAPGVYDKGEMRYASGFYQKGDGICELPSRAVVVNGVTLVADEGPEVTSIVGETSTSPDAYGNGPGAMRCVTLGNGAKVSGFTLTGGHTLAETTVDSDDDKYGGAVLSLSMTGSVMENCIITGNGAVNGGGVMLGVMVNCRLSNNVARSDGAGGYLVNAYGCYFDDFACSSRLLAYYMKLRNCTFGPRLYHADGVTRKESIGAPNSTSGDYAGSVVNDVFLLPISWSGTYDVAAFNSVFVDNGGIAKKNTTNCVFVADAETWFAGVTPKADSASPVVGLADPDMVSPLLGGVDAAGNPRVSNGAVDPGAFQSDWRAAYARDLRAKRDFVCTAASSEVRETESRGVRLGAGSIAFETKNTLTDEKLGFEAVVDGSGTLIVEADGVTLATFTSDDSPVAVEIPLASGTKPALSVRYVPGEVDAGSAELKKFRLNFELGAMLIVR